MIKALEKHIDNDFLCSTCCAALALIIEKNCKLYLNQKNLKLKQNKSTDDNQVAARNACWIEVLFKLMNRFINNHDDDPEKGMIYCNTLHFMLKDNRKYYP